MWTRRRFIEAACSTGVASAALRSNEAGAAVPALPAERTKKESSKPLSETPVQAARALLYRQLGERASQFELKLIPLEGGNEVYEISAANGRVYLAGSSAVAMCRGAYSYLRATCNVMITWSGRHVELPAAFPDAPMQRVVCPYKFVQYFNPCTYGYTMAFWDWARWEKELDWMALHGITMPLALEGQEAIWDRVWRSLGLSEAEIAEFSTGPAHLPWHRMGNVNNIDGPLPEHFIEQKRVLQRKILDRMRSLGMRPVAPAFSGFVPQGFKRLHPKAETFTLLWLPEEFKTIPRSTRTFILHPGEQDLYRLIGKKFIEEYKAEYGEVQYYLADTFNELAVPVREEHRFEDLERFGRTVYEGILAGDPNGTWVMQGWLFVYDVAFWNSESVAALLRGIPNDRMLIIDYANDLAPAVKGKYAPGQWKTQKAFFGKQWINGMAHTFGGNNNVKGNLKLMASEPASVLTSPERGNLVGWGMCPEGIETNEVVYELMTDAGWQREAIDLKQWIPAYCRSRYGACPPVMLEAWTLLMQSAYSAHIWMTHQAWQTEPSLAPAAASVDAGPTFRRAVALFLSCAPELGQKELYRNDLIELVVQAAGGSVDQTFSLAVQAGQSHQNEVATEYAAHALGWMGRMDALLNLRPDRRLETWMQAARSYAKSDDEAAYYDENARRLITTWGWPELSDYASRAWSGLTRDYYASRWEAWFASLHAGRPFSLDIWQQTWLSSPYQPSKPMEVPDLIAEAQALLNDTQHAG
ncbi:alpha-N-acetylglucosaminidase [Terriglobus saanensis]|uniref:Alpha-N-acetylglucosaminidase n=1 Tax=Terriglobus saanensis (strain ATCC BAA-1853 / DSM 23119 / SP1PR4) TaxID=401053 RepID=E8V2F6_TERSS|nr:alpha-N-acetylglucosaminidase [Terriglobus saanensis]ADV82374.1 Alpha-N-acetylglucosaminidase [Terriglobus saanensis SP1PR4]